MPHLPDSARKSSAAAVNLLMRTKAQMILYYINVPNVNENMRDSIVFFFFCALFPLGDPKYKIWLSFLPQPPDIDRFFTKKTVLYIKIMYRQFRLFLL